MVKMKLAVWNVHTGKRLTPTIKEDNIIQVESVMGEEVARIISVTEIEIALDERGTTKATDAGDHEMVNVNETESEGPTHIVNDLGKTDTEGDKSRVVSDTANHLVMGR